MSHDEDIDDTDSADVRATELVDEHGWLRARELAESQYDDSDDPDDAIHWQEIVEAILRMEDA